MYILLLQLYADNLNGSHDEYRITEQGSMDRYRYMIIYQTENDTLK